MKSNHTDRLIERLSLKYNLPKRVIRLIIMSQFEYLKKSIELATPGKFETFPSVRISSGGYPIPGRRFTYSILAGSKPWQEKILRPVIASLLFCATAWNGSALNRPPCP